MVVLLPILIVLALVVSVLFGGFCVNYILLHTVHTVLPFFWAIVLALVTGDLSLPLAIVVKVLVLLHILH